jgi:hypothetical protein
VLVTLIVIFDSHGDGRTIPPAVKFEGTLAQCKVIEREVACIIVSETNRCRAILAAMDG